MSGKPLLVEYRRTSSDMDLSSSDEETTIVQGNPDPSAEEVTISEEAEARGQEEHRNPKRCSSEKDSLHCDKSSRSSHGSRSPHGSRDERLQDSEKFRDQRSRDEARRENGKKDMRPKEYERERKDKRKDHLESKHRERSGSPDRRKRRSRERSRGRSPHHDSSHYRHRSRSPGRKKYSPERHRHSPDRRDRKRSHSPDNRSRKFRRSSPETNFRSKRLERKAARIDKLGLELFAEAKSGLVPTASPNAARDGAVGSSFFNPNNANPAARLTEQIQKRRLLWGAKKEAAPVGEPSGDGAGTSKAWEAATFKGDNDGKMTEKFKRLMGIKGESKDGSQAPPEGNALIKKQEEMFSNMEAQYQVARMATHTHRGIGLGFGTFQVPPR